MIKRLLLLIVIFVSASATGQEGQNASEIRQQIKKLKVLGSVLYFAAHPDDENTRIISYLANERLYETAYFSLTRGDGGQNLIGNEKGDLLGVIRTQELLQARKIDGGQQFFSNSVDFGYTRSEEESFQKWGLDSVLMDAVWVIRTFKPDVIILRFPTDGRGGHGHHTASASIAIMATEYAAAPMDIFNPNMPPEAKQPTIPWLPKRIFVNTGKWWVPNIDSVAAANPGKYLKLDVGGYNGLLGLSYTEIAGLSRSKHKTQGFGSALKKGEEFEYFELVYGEPATNDLMDGVNTGWSRLGADRSIETLIDSVLLTFDDENPWNSVPLLFSIREKIMGVSDEHWKKIKTKEINKIIVSCLGLATEVISPKEIWVPGTAQKLSFNVINRSPVEVNLKSIKGIDLNHSANEKLIRNSWYKFDKNVMLPDSTLLSNPYWLRQKHQNRFIVTDQKHKGFPEVENAPTYQFEVSIDNHSIMLSVPVIFKHVDRVKGELIHPVFIGPGLSVHPESKSEVFKLSQTRVLRFQVTSVADSGKMQFYPNLPKHWIGPEKVDFNISHVGQQLWVDVAITSPDTAFIDTINPYVKSGSRMYNRDQIIIRYDHIEPKMLTPLTELKLVATDLNTVGLSVAYLSGAGDEIPQIIAQLGYHVTLINPEDLKDDLSAYDALIFGVRAYNVYPELVNYHDELMRYVNDGGNIVMQYNTSRGLNIQLGPYPFKLSRERITDENAPVQILNPIDSILVYPNQIIESDFDNWVQERGLYFPEQWDSKYRTPIAFNNPEGKQLSGGLLVVNYGKGTYIYTSLAFFRQLPAGVPGAFRLFANLVAGRKKNIPLIPEEKIKPLEKQ